MRKIILNSSFIAILFITCASNTDNLKITTWKNKDIKNYNMDKYIILPFEDQNSVEDKIDYPQASNIVRDAFETAMLHAGYGIVEYTQLEKEIIKQTGIPSESTENLVIQNAVKLGADAVIYGILSSYYQGSFWGRYTTVGFSVKAIYIKSGEILWKLEISRKMQWNYDYDPNLLSKDLSKEIIQELLKN